MSLDRLRLHSEPFASTGNLGENSRRLLGTPALDRLQTLIREAVQNIADAAKLGSGPKVLIRIRELTDQQRQALRKMVFAELPRESRSRDSISGFLDREQPVVLEICDFRTTGLGGPTRADRLPIETESTDFIDFLRNIGSPRDSAHGGGTYGFGKASLYDASRCGTILVDTLVAGGGSGSRRFIGCHVGSSFSCRKGEMLRRYTGRHWWGTRDEGDDLAEPALDRKAQALSEAVGFRPRSGDESGTSIMILDFDLQGEDKNIVARRIAEALLWNFWPRMMRDVEPARRFECQVQVEGEDIELPSPEDCPVLELFSKAMRAARSGTKSDDHEIVSQRPAKRLGTLAIEKGLRVPRKRLVDCASLFPDNCHHIALMRPVELVVKYLEGSPLPDERIEWAGVFIASSDDEVERAFADSEPPAHDDWIPNGLPKGRARTFVNVGLRELRQRAFDMGSPPRRQVADGTAGPPLAQVAGLLGKFLTGNPGDGAGRKRSGGGGGRPRPPRARASRPLFARLEGGPHERVAVFETEVRQDARKSGVYLRAQAAVAMDGVAARETESIGLRPVVVGIKGPTAELSRDSDQVAINGNEGRFEIRVRCPPDCAVTLEAEVSRDSDS